MNIFSKKNVPEVNFPRNTFDLSRRDMLTTQWGKLNVVYCKEVIPGDSWQMDSAVTVNAMPTVFPLSTPVKVYVHMYYVRYKNVWKDFPDFIYKSKEGLEMPWMRFKKDSDIQKARIKEMIGTGSYGDSFNVPSTFAGSLSRTVHYDSSVFAAFPKAQAATLLEISDLLDYVNSTPLKVYTDNIAAFPSGYMACGVAFQPKVLGKKLYGSFVGSNATPTSVSSIAVAAIYPSSVMDGVLMSQPIASEIVNSVGYSVTDNIGNIIEFSDSFVSAYNSNDDVVLVLLRSGVNNATLTSLQVGGYSGLQVIPFPGQVLNPELVTMPMTSVDITANFDSVVDITDPEFLDFNPFVGDTPAIQLSALPWRCVEQIYNYYYRDDINNPYILNGNVEYNEFIPTHDGGPDDNLYPTRFRNWERDRYTSGAPSPQFGEAPLVGLISRPSVDTAVVQFADGDGNTYNATVGVDANGNAISIVDYDRNIPSGSLRYLQDSMTSTVGFSINDLRNVNAYQRFKEHQLLRGLRYRNQNVSHHGVPLDYPDIDVPQFLGGYSGTLNTPRVMQSATTAEASLGDFNGQIVGTVSSQNTINCYCPEYGCIVGIMSIIPVPVYSQTLDPMMTRMTALDFYQQEFSKIGNVPIFMSEVAPVQSADPSKVFAYQKAWTEYMQDTDHVHGDFRTNLKDFMLMRTFAGEPTLSRDFTVCDPDQLNDVFAAGKIADAYGSTDRLLCEFNIHAIVKRQIPRHGTPSLE